MSCQSGFKFPFSGTCADFDDVFVRKEFFSEGGLWAWGSDSFGALGNNAGGSSYRLSPVQTVSGGTNWKTVGATSYNSAAIKSDGTLWTFGSNGDGRIGDNTTVTRSSPVQTVSGGNNWRTIALGFSGPVAIKTDGSLWSWGYDEAGRSGANTFGIARSSPVQTVSGGTTWKQAGAGRAFSVAIKTDGTLWTWGDAGYGALGTNATTNRSSPVQTVSGGTDWQFVTTGTHSVAAIKTDNTLWLWGRGYNGMLGDNAAANRSSPVQTVAGGNNWKQASMGTNHTLAIKTDGSLWLWGINSSGQLGINSTLSRSSPVQTVSGATNWKLASAGYSGHSSAIKADGTLWIWGLGSCGRLGTSTNTSVSSPVQTVAGGTTWSKVALGDRTSLTIREDCW